MSRKPSTKTSRPPDAEEALSPSPVPNPVGKICVDGHKIPSPGARTAEVKAYWEHLQNAHFFGLHGSGRQELERMRDALKKCLDSLEGAEETAKHGNASGSGRRADSRSKKHKSCGGQAQGVQTLGDESSQPGVDLRALGQSRLREYLSDALDQMEGFISQLNWLAEISLAVKFLYDGKELRGPDWDCCSRLLDSLPSPEEAERGSRRSDGSPRDPFPDEAYTLALQGLRIGLLFSRIAIWNYLPDAHESSRQKQRSKIGGDKSATFTADQKDALYTLYNEKLDSPRV